MGSLMAGRCGRNHGAQESTKADPSAESEDPTVRVIYGSYDHENPVIQMKAIKEALHAYYSAE